MLTLTLARATVSASSDVSHDTRTERLVTEEPPPRKVQSSTLAG